MSSVETGIHIGIAAAPGLAEGPAALWIEQAAVIPRSLHSDADAERARLAAAREAARMEIARLSSSVAAHASATEAAVFDAHTMFLDDSALLKRVNAAIDAGLNAEAAWMDAIAHFAGQLADLPDPTLRARAADVHDVGERVLGHLLGRVLQPALDLRAPSVIVARDLTPSQTAGLDTGLALAFCTAEGGPTSHTAILAKALGLPAVVGIGPAVLDVPPGTSLLVDGDRGEVIVDPDAATRQNFQARREQIVQRTQADLRTAHEGAVTRDGRRVEVVANVGSPQEAASALEAGAEGIGLLRTEFLYLNRQTAPDEEEQLAAYVAILAPMGRRPVVVRTLDVGGDKALPYLDLGREQNPFLGWRAIRMCLDQPEFFKVQLRALLRASPDHDLRVMFPMVATLGELRRARALLEEARWEVEAAGHTVAPAIQIGMMVEVPSAALLAEQFAREVDFFSVGTNDLTQYTLAAERGNRRVAYLGDAYHPAVLRLIQLVVEAAQHSGIWVGVCGELAGDSEAVPILLGLGVDELSMAPTSIPHIKAAIRDLSVREAEQTAAEALRQASATDVRRLVQRHLRRDAT
jgi:phosphoenolpyruvate-protein phosphotransferase